MECDARRSGLEELVACVRAKLQKRGEPMAADCTRLATFPSLPVSGKRVLNFTQATLYGKPSNGIAIETMGTTPVSAPMAGRVLFAGEWRSFGPLLILDAGCGRDVLIIGPMTFHVVEGERVARGGLVGQVSPPAEGYPPVIYYEVRQDGVPVDPERQ